MAIISVTTTIIVTIIISKRHFKPHRPHPSSSSPPFSPHPCYSHPKSPKPPHPKPKPQSLPPTNQAQAREEQLLTATGNLNASKKSLTEAKAVYQKAQGASTAAETKVKTAKLDLIAVNDRLDDVSKVFFEEVNQYTNQHTNQNTNQHIDLCS